MHQKHPTSHNDLVVKAFVHTVSTKNTTGKRFVAIRKLLSKNVLWTNKQCAHIWKGLYYAIWYSEMNKGGEQLIQEIAQLCNSESLIIAGFEALSREWVGIDYIRIDKYMFLVRHLTKQVLRIDFDRGSNILAQIVNICSSTCGLMYHLIEVFLVELKKVMKDLKSTDKAKAEFIVKTVTPFAHVMSTSTDNLTLDTINESIFSNLKKELLNGESKDFQRVTLEKLIDVLMSVGGNAAINSKHRGLIYTIVKKMKKKVEKIDLDDDDHIYNDARKRKKQSNSRGKRMKRDETKRVFVRSLYPVADE